MPNKKPESGLSIRSVKRFSRTSQKVSIELANETENRLLKSGKDTLQQLFGFLLQEKVFFLHETKIREGVNEIPPP